MGVRVDRSGPLRASNSCANINSISKVDLPALAVIMAYIAKRPAWEDKQPFPVPPDLYASAEAEMREHMKKRGFPLPVAKDLEQDGIVNFLLLGTPIVVKTDG